MKFFFLSLVLQKKGAHYTSWKKSKSRQSDWWRGKFLLILNVMSFSPINMYWQLEIIIWKKWTDQHDMSVSLPSLKFAILTALILAVWTYASRVHVWTHLHCKWPCSQWVFIAKSIAGTLSVLGGRGFDSCQELGVFLCPMLMSYWSVHFSLFTFHFSLLSLKFTILTLEFANPDHNKSIHICMSFIAHFFSFPACSYTTIWAFCTNQKYQSKIHVALNAKIKSFKLSSYQL